MDSFFPTPPPYCKMDKMMMTPTHAQIRVVCFTIVLLLSIFSVDGLLLASDQRGIRVRLKTQDNPDARVSEEVELYSKSYALVIGIDDYHNGWPRLSNAVADAEKVAEGLREKGFEITFKKNLSSSELKNVFEEFFIFKGDDPQARLFIWFAGHGHTLEHEGFLVPNDAPTPTPKKSAKFKYTALSMRRFNEFVRLAKSKHTLAVFDACFAGTIFQASRSLPPAAITRMTTYPVRQFLTSGDADQTVSDDGRFAKLFLRALKGEAQADYNNDGYLTGTELGLYLSNRVTNLTHARQTPRYGKYLDEDYDRGDFIFVLPRPEPLPLESIVTIESNVSGADVLVDGNFIGKTDLREAKVPSGKHELVLVKNGYEPHNQVKLFKQGREIMLYIQLTPNPPPKQVQSAPSPAGKLFVECSPKDATIKIENSKQPFRQGVALPAGQYLIVVEAEGHKSTNQWVTLESGRERHVNVELEWIEPPKTISQTPTPAPPPKKRRARTLPPISF